MYLYFDSRVQFAIQRRSRHPKFVPPQNITTRQNEACIVRHFRIREELRVRNQVFGDLHIPLIACVKFDKYVLRVTIFYSDNSGPAVRARTTQQRFRARPCSLEIKIHRIELHGTLIPLPRRSAVLDANTLELASIVPRRPLPAAWYAGQIGNPFPAVSEPQPQPVAPHRDNIRYEGGDP